MRCAVPAATHAHTHIQPRIAKRERTHIFRFNAIGRGDRAGADVRRCCADERAGAHWKWADDAAGERHSR